MKFRFIDSHRFMASPLEELSFFLNIEQLKVLRKEFEILSAERFSLLMRKDIFPYNYIDS